jgi:hypothetical protein
LDNAHPEDVKQAIIDVLREGDGARLRSLLKALRDSDDETGLYEKLIQHQALHDLVHHSELFASDKGVSRKGSAGPKEAS